METAYRLITYVSEGNIAALEQEFKNGVDLNSMDYDLRTPFHIASALGNQEVVKWFIDKNIPYKIDRFGTILLFLLLLRNCFFLHK